MAQAKKGKNVLLLWRLLKDAKEKDGALMMFQTEHSVEKSRDSDNVVTKTGTLKNVGGLEEEVPFTSLCANGDPVLDYLNTAIDDGEELELWEVDMNEASQAGKYPAKYRRGYLSELNYTANAEDNMEVEGTFATEMKAQKGEVSLTPAQMEAVQYQFRGIEKVTE